jgi:hypothetical protein
MENVFVFNNTLNFNGRVDVSPSPAAIDGLENRSSRQNSHQHHVCVGGTADSKIRLEQQYHARDKLCI